MLYITEAKKEEFWTALSAEKRPPVLTAARMRQLKAVVWQDKDFWDDVVARHGGLDLTPAELQASDPWVYAHCLGNFQGMLCETAWRLWRR